MEFGNSRGGRIRDFLRLSLFWVVGKIRGGVVDGVWKFEGGRIRDFRLSLSSVVGKIRGGVVDEVSKFEGGRIRRISWGILKFFHHHGGQGGQGWGQGGQRWDQGGPGLGPGGARAGARGGHGWGQGGPWPPGPPAGYGPANPGGRIQNHKRWPLRTTAHSDDWMKYSS